MTHTPSDQQVGPAVTFGLVAAWALHDAEELATVRRSLRRHVPVLRERFPQVSEAVWRRLESVDTREFAVAVGLVGTLVAAASAAGRATGGRSAVYQTTLNAFGLHGLVHLAQAAAVRGHTPGSATSPVVVVPFTLWARARLRRAGALRPTRPRDLALGLALAGGAALASHAAAHRLLGGRSAT
ncbi:HXXEE domain-containing protein [Streptomyces sp. NPDC058451]|uniref:HXXEE domain-containing protein n=1 Tax=Streptomyces sp. NPDC058451 TaxID=3346506 RepID=UPI00365A467B